MKCKNCGHDEKFHDKFGGGNYCKQFEPLELDWLYKPQPKEEGCGKLIEKGIISRIDKIICGKYCNHCEKVHLHPSCSPNSSNLNGQESENQDLSKARNVQLNSNEEKTDIHLDAKLDSEDTEPEKVPVFATDSNSGSFISRDKFNNFIQLLKEVRDDLWKRWKNNEITFTELDAEWLDSIDKLSGDLK